VEEQPGWQKGLGTVFTFSLAALAWVPFRMPVNIAIQYWQGLFRWTMPDIYSFRLMLVGKLPEQTWASLEIPNPILVGVLVIAVIFDIQQSRSKRDEFILDWPRLQVILLVVVLLFTTLLSVLSDQVAPFVYQGF
jgi:flagellar biosynthesis protein FliQ